MNILIIDDETRLVDAMSHILSVHQCSVTGASDGAAGLDEALTGRYDVILLDFVSEKFDGRKVLKSIRSHNISTPVLMLTAKDYTLDGINGDELGAYDYIAKPFLAKELLARLRALSRESRGLSGDKYLCFSDIDLNLNTLELACADSSVSLGKKEFCILQMLMRAGGRLLSKEQLIKKIWGDSSSAKRNNVEVYISFLRKKLELIHSSTAIKTMRGIGYMLVQQADKA